MIKSKYFAAESLSGDSAKPRRVLCKDRKIL